MPLGAARFGLLGGVADLGKLELIETQTITSSTATADFTSLGSYNVHFMTFNDMKPVTDGTFVCARLSNDGGSSYLSSGYQYALQSGTASGTFAESRSTSSTVLFISNDTGTGTNEVANSYAYFYNLLDSSKYSFLTNHSTDFNSSASYEMWFGSGVKPTAETHNAIRILFNSGNISTGTISLYGIAES